VPKLIILRGENIERELELGTQDLRIGRGAENDLILEDPTKAVSRFHAEIRPEGQGWVLIDLNSQNGTWIDGKRIQKTALAPGVTVSLGPYHLKYQDAAAASAAPAASAPAASAAPSAMPATTDTLVGGKMRAPAPAAPARSATPARPPAKPIAKTKGARPSSDDNIVSRLVKNKPLLFGGFGAFMVLIIIAGQMMKSSSSASSPASPKTPAAQAEVPAPAQPSNAEIIAKHLADGKALLEKGDAEAALRDHFEQVLVIDPNQPEATELKLKAEEMLRQSRASAAPPAPVPSTPAAQPAPAAPAASQPPVASAPAKPAAPPVSSPAPAAQQARQVDNFGIARNPGESQADWRARSNRTRDRYNEAKAALQRNEFETAIAGLESLDRDQPNYQDVRAQLAAARAGLQASAQDVMANAAKLEKSGDYAAALAQLNRAKQLDASISIDESVRRIREQTLKEADDAYSRARVYDARGRIPEAVALYERVVQLLPPEHPNRKAAQDRLMALRAKPQ
jgi:tetratricopeptide (TPR) repeat protein